MGYFDSSMKTAEPRQDWTRKFIEDEPQQWERHVQDCLSYKQLFKDETESFKQTSNHTDGMFIYRSDQNDMFMITYVRAFVSIPVTG